MWNLDWVPAAAFGLSVVATAIGVSAERRSRRLEKRADQAALREEVHFTVTKVQRDARNPRAVEVEFVNDGHATARDVEIGAESIRRVAMDGMSIFGSMPPNKPDTFRYFEPHSTLKSFEIVWRGPGTGSQHLSIPDAE